VPRALPAALADSRRTRAPVSTGRRILRPVFIARRPGSQSRSPHPAAGPYCSPSWLAIPSAASCGRSLLLAVLARNPERRILRPVLPDHHPLRPGVAPPIRAVPGFSGKRHPWRLFQARQKKARPGCPERPARAVPDCSRLAIRAGSMAPSLCSPAPRGAGSAVARALARRGRPGRGGEHPQHRPSAGEGSGCARLAMPRR